MRGWIFVSVVLVIQALCAFFFVSDILLSVFGIYVEPLSWATREYLEVGAAIGLVLGLFLGGVALYRIMHDRHVAEEKLRRASGAFMDLLAERFADWGLTAAESDVALFAIKGMSTQEIAALQQAPAPIDGAKLDAELARVRDELAAVPAVTPDLGPLEA